MKRIKFSILDTDVVDVAPSAFFAESWPDVASSSGKRANHSKWTNFANETASDDWTAKLRPRKLNGPHKSSMAMSLKHEWKISEFPSVKRSHKKHKMEWNNSDEMIHVIDIAQFSFQPIGPERQRAHVFDVPSKKWSF